MIGQKLGQYTITALIGTGGMATVYRARQESVKRDVAIKVIQSALTQDPNFVRRFEREAEIVASLSSPHIVKIFDFGREGDLLYIVMELLTGGSLADRLRREAMPLEKVAATLDQIASALDYAHARGIIHRDLKPQNVLLDERGNAFLTDFGVARLLEDATRGLTATGLAMGTPSYMSPEQWQGAALDARSDLYSLGVVLFEMISGGVPFRADTPFALMHKHIYEQPPRLSTIRTDIAPSIEEVLERALAKRPSDRYQSAEELAAAFRAAIHDPDRIERATSYDLTSPVSMGARSSQPRAGRSRGWLILVLLLILGGTGIGLFLALRSGDEASTPTAVAAIQTVTASPSETLPAATATASSTITAIPSATFTLVPTSTPMPTLTATATLSVRDAAVANQQRRSDLDRHHVH
ncbi:MAG: protein kinase [Anaerolineae bacterium]